MSRMRLLLFDIDGTLLRSHGGGRALLRAALVHVFGTDGAAATFEFAGNTDLGIVTQLMQGAGFDARAAADGYDAVHDYMARHADAVLSQHGTTPLPGVLPLLDRLRARDDVVLGLLTGNGSRTYASKLRLAGIDPDWFVVGAFGSDHADRNALPALAYARAAARFGRTVHGSDSVVIGDTPSDIACARAGAARAVAVATGIWNAAALADCRPDALFHDFTDTEAVLAALLHPATPPNKKVAATSS